MSPATFKERFLPLRNGLYKVAFYILESDVAAEDALQELYTRLWFMRDRIPDLDNPKAYCIRMMKNICMDQIRRSSVRRAETLDKAYGVSADTAEDEMENREKLLQVQNAMKQLSDREATVLRLRVFEEMEYGRISEIMGLSELSLRVLLSSVRKKIRKLVDNGK